MHFILVIVCIVSGMLDGSVTLIIILKKVPISASAIACKEGNTFLPTFKQVNYETPRAMNLGNIACKIADYSRGAANALVAGFI